MIGHSHLAVIQKHAVHLLDGAVGGVLRLEVDEGVAFGAVLVTHHLEDTCRHACECRLGGSDLSQEEHLLHEDLYQIKSTLSDMTELFSTVALHD